MSAVPPPFPGEKVVCPYCRETIIAGAIKCRHCGEFIYGRREADWNPNIAGLLSFLIVGAGQIYKGMFWEAAGLLSAYVACLIIALVADPILPLVGAIGIWAYGIYDAVTNRRPDRS